MLSAVVLHTRLAERQREIDQLEQQVDVSTSCSTSSASSEPCCARRPAWPPRAAGSGCSRRRSPTSSPSTRGRVAQIIAATGSTGRLDGLLVDSDALDQVRRVRAAEAGHDAGRRTKRRRRHGAQPAGAATGSAAGGRNRAPAPDHASAISGQRGADGQRRDAGTADGVRVARRGARPPRLRSGAADKRAGAARARRQIKTTKPLLVNRFGPVDRVRA